MRKHAAPLAVACIIITLLSSIALPLVSSLSGNAEVTRNKNLQSSELNAGNADVTRYRNLQSPELGPNNADVSRTRNLQTLELAPPPTYRLTVVVVNCSGLPVSDALVTAANATNSTDPTGVAFLDLPLGTYNVTASKYPDYLPASWLVDLDNDKNISLTLSSSYVFLGEISDSQIIIESTGSGYNITLLNNLTLSGVDVYFDWRNAGTIAAGSWGNFAINQMPLMIVMAATRGSNDYPHAWYKRPLPTDLVPTTGLEGAFLPEPVPYLAGSIYVTPYPPVFGENTTIGVTLHNPYNYTLAINPVDFQISSLTIGPLFTSVGYVADVSFQANETRNIEISWVASISGHHCVKVVLTYAPSPKLGQGLMSVMQTEPPPLFQVLERNMEIEDDVVQGGTGEVPFWVKNPYGNHNITIRIEQRLPPNWKVELEVNGKEHDATSDFVYDAAPGEELNAVLRIKSNNDEPGTGTVDVKAYIEMDGNVRLLGGLQKKMTTIPPDASISLYGLNYGAPQGFEGEQLNITGKGWFPGSLIKLWMSKPFFHLADVDADMQGKFAIPVAIPGMGSVPLPVVIVSADSEKQSAWTTFFYFGNRADMENLGDCLKAIFLANLLQLLKDSPELIKYVKDPWALVTGGKLLCAAMTRDDFPFGDFVAIIAKIFTNSPVGGVIGCSEAIIRFVSRHRQHLDVIVTSAMGAIGTNGQGEYVNNVSCSWASGNNFGDDRQLIIMNLTKSFNVTIDATRAEYQTESYNLSIGFVCTIANRTAFAYLSGEIQKGTQVKYRVDLVNWTVSITKLDVHEIGITGIESSKTVVGQGYPVGLNVTVQNYGNFTESFNLTGYANGTEIQKTLVTLAGTNQTTIMLDWNTTSFAKGNYTISAYAEPVPGQTNTANNNFTDGSVLVTVPGDVNGDGQCDMQDITILIDKFLTRPTNPQWNPNCDINNDNVVDMADISIAIDNFLKAS